MYHLMHLIAATIKLKSKYKEPPKERVLENNEIIKVFDKKTWPQLSPKKLKSLHWIIDILKSFPKNYKSTSAKFPVKVSLKLKTEKYDLMKKKVLPSR